MPATRPLAVMPKWRINKCCPGACVRACTAARPRSFRARRPPLSATFSHLPQFGSCETPHSPAINPLSHTIHSNSTTFLPPTHPLSGYVLPAAKPGLLRPAAAAGAVHAGPPSAAAGAFLLNEKKKFLIQNPVVLSRTLDLEMGKKKRANR